jgi:hypothetical protein
MLCDPAARLEALNETLVIPVLKLFVYVPSTYTSILTTLLLAPVERVRFRLRFDPEKDAEVIVTVGGVGGGFFCAILVPAYAVKLTELCV